MIIPTLNIVESGSLLEFKKYSSIKDLGTVCTMLGELVHAYINLTGEVLCLEDDEENSSWPYIFADYVKRHDIPMGKIGKPIFALYNDPWKLTWKPRAAPNRYKWKAKVRLDSFPRIHLSDNKC